MEYLTDFMVEMLTLSSKRKEEDSKENKQETLFLQKLYFPPELWHS